MEAEITACMLYYGRKNFAEEAIESFLRQTYPHKRLVIVSTHPDGVHFEQDYPEIEVHNLSTDAFENLNEKYNYAFSQIRMNWWCPWDSDDIWMPWHMESLVAGIPSQRWNAPLKVGVPQCYFAMSNVIKQFGWNMWTNCIFETLDSKGNLHPQCDDTVTDNCDKQILLRKKWKRVWLRDLPPSLIFRWDDEPHGSSVVGELAPAYHASLRAKMNAISITEPFRPHWDRDYVADAEQFNSEHDWHKSKYRYPIPKEKK